jgi:tRNA nucleotidyltransferase (CCA-adding enzyme)
MKKPRGKAFSDLMPLSFAPLAAHPAVRALVAAAREAPCHLVGGVLRDFALGLPVHDVDAVVAGGGREIAQRLEREIPARLVFLGGKEFAAFRLVFGDEVIDLWDRERTTLFQDLARRDFTVNSFAWDPVSGEVVDPFDGRADLERRRLRATTGDSFTGDPLRVLRLPRLLLRLPGFAADPETVELARRSAPRLADIAAERIRDELALLFAHPEAERGVRLLGRLDLYPGLWIGEAGEPGEAGEAADLLGTLEAAAGRLALPESIFQGLAESLRPARWAATFLPLPDGREALGRCRDRGFLTRKEADAVALLLAEPRLPSGEVEGRRFLARTGAALWPAALALLAARAERAGEGTAARDSAAAVVALVLRGGNELFSPPRLLSGNDVRDALGIPPGPELGRILAGLAAEQIDGRIRTREEAQAWLLRWAGER